MWRTFRLGREAGEEERGRGKLGKFWEFWFVRTASSSLFPAQNAMFFVQMELTSFQNKDSIHLVRVAMVYPCDLHTVKTRIMHVLALYCALMIRSRENASSERVCGSCILEFTMRRLAEP